MAYDVPTAAELKQRFPAFGTVDDEVVDYWITDGQRFVDTSWIEGDYAPALLSLAAHNMALAGLGTDASLAAVPAGVSRFKSGSLEVAMTDAAANARATGSLDSTRYGSEYLVLLRRNKAGPRVSATGIAPFDTYLRFPQGQA
ncbi:MAG: DUF4054 domain-containing protein [Methylocystis sp.]|uniref:DUF4054 domain-containing protein n=1 Tax=Methylocystis sp. TaxID=1911079 RepID=UPI003DA6A643